MKKGSYWFAFLSEKEQKEFRENVKNADNDFTELINTEYEYFEHFIVLAFWFDETPQGYKYWCEISERKIK